jgi:hypothetical protein
VLQRPGSHLDINNHKVPNYILVASIIRSLSCYFGSLVFYVNIEIFISPFKYCVFLTFVSMRSKAVAVVDTFIPVGRLCIFQ